MFRYLTSYRFQFSAKVGFGAAYLWYVADFIRIHVAIWHGLGLLLPDFNSLVISGDPQLDGALRRWAISCSSRTMVYLFAALAPVACGLFLWGRHKWLQCAVGWWISLSMIALDSLVGVFSSTVDVWLNLTFIIYGLVALTSSSTDWEASEGAFRRGRWRQNPTLASSFAWLVVWLQFNVYLFAGVNKLALGWVPWTTGVALQNLAVDSSIHDFVRGVHVPLWLSVVLCYITLLQRLVVPFGFFFRRGRLWAALILGTMHVGYAILMNVNLFPLIGLASLLVVLPPRPAAPAAAKGGTPPCSPAAADGWLKPAVIAMVALALAGESTRLVHFSPRPWENQLMLTPGWRMFADGGVAAGGEWRVILTTRRERIDATLLARQPLPHLWRDRFYLNNIFNDLMNRNVGPGSLVDRLGRAARRLYHAREIEQRRVPSMVTVGFELYQWQPPAPR